MALIALLSLILGLLAAVVASAPERSAVFLFFEGLAPVKRHWLRKVTTALTPVLLLAFIIIAAYVAGGR